MIGTGDGDGDGEGDGMIQDGDTRRPMTEDERREQVKRLVTVFCCSIL